MLSLLALSLLVLWGAAAVLTAGLCAAAGRADASARRDPPTGRSHLRLVRS